MKSISEYLEEDRIKWSTRPYLTVKNGTWQICPAVFFCMVFKIKTS